MMYKYLKLEDEISITDSNFADEAIEYMDREGIENCDEGDFLEAFEKFNVANEVLYNPLVDDCFNIIQNYVKIGKYIMGYGDPIIYFSKAIDVMYSELQIAIDYDELDEYTWELANDYLNASSANFAYAQSIIYDSLVETFGKDNSLDKKTLSIYSQDVRKEILDIYKQIAIPHYEVIKQITINEVEFTDIRKAQEYINKYIIEEAEDIYCHENFIDIKVVLTDEMGVFEINFDISEAYSQLSLWEDSLLEILISPYDYFGDGLDDILGIEGQKYTMALEAYKKYDVGTVDFSVINDVICDDIYELIGNEYPEEMMHFAYRMLRKNYENDIDILMSIGMKESDACKRIRETIFKRHNFEIPYNYIDDRMDDEYISLCYKLMLLKSFAIEGHKINKEYNFSEAEHMHNVYRAFSFINYILDAPD